MKVDPSKTTHKSEHSGQTYYFCSEHCKQKFDKSPKQFTKKTA
jgi:P-type Cu+ transporter